MANRERGEQRLVAGDRSFILRLTVGACCELEDRSGKPLEILIEQVNSGSVKALRLVLWASLQDYHALEIATVEQAGEVMDAIGSVPAVIRILSTFLASNVDERPSGDEPSDDDEKAEKKKTTWRQLYVEARKHGLSARAFWSLSLLELWREAAAWRERQRDEWNRDMRVAWYTAALMNQKKLPALASLQQTSVKAAPRKQTWQEMKAYMKGLSAAQAAAEKKKGKDGRRSRAVRK